MTIPTLTTRGPDLGEVVLKDDDGQWRYFRRPRRVLQTVKLEEVVPLLEQTAEAVEREGLHAAGWLAYEAAGAMDPACRTRPPGDFPLLWFGLYDEPIEVALPAPSEPGPPIAWRPDMHLHDYLDRIERIKNFIAAGDTYQVNFSLRMEANLPDAWPFFLRRLAPLANGYSAFVQTERFQIASASPELFFELSAGRIASRPMKGTRPRGATAEEDAHLRDELRASEKDRAENVMITDMIRNDLGRIARPGTVRVADLFRIEAYPTVWQMTSTVEATTDARLPEIFRALFPCASITGAPKIRTMQIIDELETSPRCIYTGTIGYVAPPRRARFNVAIRTLLLDRQTGRARYGTGSGIVWDSDARGEYRECLAKTKILSEPNEPFRLLETMLYVPGEGVWLRRRHLARLAASAGYFGFARDEREIVRRLDAIDSPRFLRLRLLLDRDGGVELQSAELETDPRNPSRPWRVALAEQPIPSDEPFLFHKTTRREIYQQARQGHDDLDDVLLWNEREEMTESTLANVVVQLDGERLTPPTCSGLLAGAFRSELLERKEVREQVLTVDDLARAERLWLINAVRGWIPVVLVGRS